MYIFTHTHIHINVFRPSQDSSVWLELTSREQLISPECSKHQVLRFSKMLVCGEQTKSILFSSVFSRVLNEWIQSVYIHRHVFRPSQESSVWLGLTSREQMMSSGCSKHQVLRFAKRLVVWWTNKNHSVLISVLQSAERINSERIYSEHIWYRKSKKCVGGRWNDRLKFPLC